jgi:glycosyltransferase involved in cell wall biosynthesis
MKIVHITSDFPDSFSEAKTRAISNLVDITRDSIEHHVYSLNRSHRKPMRVASALFGSADSVDLVDAVTMDECSTLSLQYHAPPLGIFLRTGLMRVAEWIANDLERRGIRPDIVHGHKLTMEGLAAEFIAAKLGVPYALSIQGNTDRKILSVRPELKSVYRRVFHGAAVVFPFAPWALNYVEAQLGSRAGPTVVLPVATQSDAILSPRLVGPKLVSAFHLKHYRLKNADALISASAKLEKELADFEMSILGGGTSLERQALQTKINRSGASSVHLEGAVKPHRIQERFNEAGGFALVSHHESFGMVFVEALLAGCPIVYPQGCAVEGYFDGYPFAVSASSADQSGITEGMRMLARDEKRLKSALGEWQQKGGADRFQREAIADAYVTAIDDIMKGHGQTSEGAESDPRVVG